MRDTLSHLFSNIKNGQRSKTLIIKHAKSKIAIAVLNILQENGYIRGYYVEKGVEENRKYAKTGKSVGFANSRIEILLKYKNQKGAINKLVRISKPSKRVYISSFRLKQIRNSTIEEIGKPDKISTTNDFIGIEKNFMKGIYILSTPKGIISDINALKLNVGGEVLGYIV